MRHMRLTPAHLLLLAGLQTGVGACEQDVLVVSERFRVPTELEARQGSAMLGAPDAPDRRATGKPASRPEALPEQTSAEPPERMTDPEPDPPNRPPVQLVREYRSFTQVAKLPMKRLAKRRAWRRSVPGVSEIAIPRTRGGADQPSLWYNPGGDERRPLLLSLHSWSADYRQHSGIPLGAFAVKNDWIFIRPNFRGPFNKKNATASEAAVQDVLDALAYAKAHANVNERCVFVTGFSGGAMMTLVMVGRYPERFTAAAAWVPVYDLNDWYRTVRRSPHGYARDYREDIEASCGGRPDRDKSASAECEKRSPSSYIRNARQANTKVFISGGLQDHFVPPSHAIRTFNDLAHPSDRISEDDYLFIDKTEALPEGLKGQGETDSLFEEAGLPVVFKRSSGNAVLVLFDGGHNIVYNVGLLWLSNKCQVSQ